MPLWPARQHLVQQLVARALAVAMSPIERPRLFIPVPELQRDIGAPPADELVLGGLQQFRSDGMAAL